MARPASRPRIAPHWRALGVLVAVSLVPLLVAAGVFAPKLVEIAREAVDDQPATVREGVIDPVRVDRPPLLVPRDFSAGFVPELVDLESLLARTQFSGFPDARRDLLRLLAIHPDHDDLIALTDSGPRAREIELEEILGSLPALPWPPMIDPASELLVIRGASSRLQPATPRFAARVPIIPEPGTATLLGPGLVYLFYRRSRS